MTENQEAVSKKKIFFKRSNPHKITCIKHLVCIISAPPALPVSYSSHPWGNQFCPGSDLCPVPAAAPGGCHVSPLSTHWEHHHVQGQLMPCGAILCQMETVADGYHPFGPHKYQSCALLQTHRSLHLGYSFLGNPVKIPLIWCTDFLLIHKNKYLIIKI